MYYLWIKLYRKIKKLLLYKGKKFHLFYNKLDKVNKDLIYQKDIADK